VEGADLVAVRWLLLRFYLDMGERWRRVGGAYVCKTALVLSRIDLASWNMMCCDWVLGLRIGLVDGPIGRECFLQLL
jgi:hypothetical protein